MLTGAEPGSGAGGSSDSSRDPSNSGTDHIRSRELPLSLRGQNNTHPSGPQETRMYPLQCRRTSATIPRLTHISSRPAPPPPPYPASERTLRAPAGRIVGVRVHNVLGRPRLRQPHSGDCRTGREPHTKLATYSFSVPLRVAREVESSLVPRGVRICTTLNPCECQSRPGGGGGSKARADTPPATPAPIN